MDLFDPIFVALRDEAKVFNRATAGLSGTRGWPRPREQTLCGLPATAAALQIEGGQRRQNRFRSNRALAPTCRARSASFAPSKAIPCWRIVFVQRVRRTARGALTSAMTLQRMGSMIAHPVLYVLSDGDSSPARAVRLKRAKRFCDGLINKSLLSAELRVRPSSRGDMRRRSAVP